VIVTDPAATVVIAPDEEIEAVDGSLLVHVPPLIGSVNVVVAPRHRAETPAIGATVLDISEPIVWVVPAA